MSDKNKNSKSLGIITFLFFAVVATSFVWVDRKMKDENNGRGIGETILETVEPSYKHMQTRIDEEQAIQSELKKLYRPTERTTSLKFTNAINPANSFELKGKCSIEYVMVNFIVHVICEDGDQLVGHYVWMGSDEYAVLSFDENSSSNENSFEIPGKTFMKSESKGE